MQNKKGSSRFSAMFLALGFVALLVGVVFKFSPLGRNEGPPSFNPGATLFQGMLGGEVENLSYYYVTKTKTVADIMECTGMGDKAGFVYYAPGDGVRNEGYYVYQIADATRYTEIENPRDFILMPGKVFGLTMKGKPSEECAVPTTKFSGMRLDAVLGTFGSGWVPVVADSPNLSDVVGPLKNRIFELWVQDGVNSFRKVEMENLEKDFFTGYYAIWLKLYTE